MNDPDALAKAQRFAQIAYSATLGDIARDSQQKRREARARLAASGAVLSGGMIREDAKIDGEQITANIKARLNALFER